MMTVTVLCVGKLKEPHYLAATQEYIKRLGAFCTLSIVEIDELTKTADPSPAQLADALNKEAQAILGKIPSGAQVWALCIEGRKLTSAALAEKVALAGVSGVSRLCFIIGGSNGLHESVKSRASVRLSMSDMTFPHHLARVMLLEQLYRAFQINSGGKYHK